MAIYKVWDSRLTPIIKSANEVVNNSNTLQNDDELRMTVAANADFFINYLILYDSDAAADFKCKWTAPTGAEFYWGYVAQWEAPSAIFTIASTATGIGGAGVGTILGLAFWGIYIGGANSGTLQFQWAQNTAHASNTTVRAGSLIIPIRCI